MTLSKIILYHQGICSSGHMQALTSRPVITPSVPQSLPSSASRSLPGALPHIRGRLGRRASLAAAAGLLSGVPVLNRLFGQEEPAGQMAEAHTFGNFRDNAPSWADLQNLLDKRKAELHLPEPDLEAGPTNAQTLKRTFGKTNTPRVKLYRDSAAWCPYCQKVWMQLEEKQIPYTLEKINMRCYGPKPPSYSAMVPSGLLPAMELDGQLVIESADIMWALEEAFPQSALLPPQGSQERQRALQLLRLERQLFGDWLRWLCSSWNHEGGKRKFEATMDQVDGELGAAGGPFFLGKDLSLVDIVFVPFLERIVASIVYYKGLVVRGQGRWPNIEAWFEALERRPTYLGTCSDFYTHVHDLPPQLGDCVSAPAGKAYREAIDGLNGSWHLPLDPLNSSSLEPYCPGEQPEADRWRAAARLIGNHAAVVKFAARGVGEEGDQPVWARLSDPSAKPGTEFLGDVDAGMRHVAHALLVGTDAKQAGEQQLVKDAEGSPGRPVAISVNYMATRVGVPRDLPLPAARQLRAHLNWFMDTVEGL